MFHNTDRRVAAAGAIALALMLTIGWLGLHRIGALVGASQWAPAHGVTSELQLMICLLGAASALLLVVSIVLFRRQASAHRLTRDALHVSETRLSLIIANMVAGLITTSASGRIESANPAAERIFGCTAGEMIGRPFNELLAWSAGPRLDEAGILLARAISRITEWEGKRATGETFPLELSVVPYETGTGHQFEAYIVDISDRRDSDRLKDEFVSVVSHELRTPLTSIRAALQLVLEERPAYQDPDHEPLLEIALKNCERLILSINDILDVSKSDAGLMHLKLSRCDIAAVVGTALRIVEPSARAAGIAVAVDVDPGLPAISGDFERLVQVLVNLLSNAVKFAPAGSIVAVTGARRADAIAVSVRDRGPGIAEEEIGKLFGRFKQLAGPAPRSEGGTGLGLSIVKSLVEGHGGQVTVDSLIGEGSTFTVTLPIHAGASRPSSQISIAMLSADRAVRGASLQA